MSRSYRKAIVKYKYSGTQDEGRRHRREHRRVSQAIARYGEDADMHLEPENYYEGESRVVINNKVIQRAKARADVMKHVLDEQLRFVPYNKTSFEFESKHGSVFWGVNVGRNENLETWFPIATYRDFVRAKRAVGCGVGFGYGSMEWEDWMEDPENLYKKTFERK